MAAPDPEGAGLLAVLIGAATAIVAPFMVARSWVEKRLATKADKEVVDNHRDDIKELFGKVDGLKDDINRNHVETLKAIHESRK